MKKVNFLKKNLIVSMIIGILVALFGIILMFQGTEFLSIVVLIYGLFSIYSGVRGFLIVSRLTVNEKNTKNSTIFSSLISIIIGLIIIMSPYFASRITQVTIVYIIAVQLLFSGLNFLFSSLSLRNTDFHSSSYFANGIFNTLLALIFFIFPTQVAQFFLSVIGIICIIYGLTQFLWSWRLKRVEKEFKKENIEGEFEKIDE